MRCYKFSLAIGQNWQHFSLRTKSFSGEILCQSNFFPTKVFTIRYNLKFYSDYLWWLNISCYTCDGYIEFVECIDGLVDNLLPVVHQVIVSEGDDIHTSRTGNRAKWRLSDVTYIAWFKFFALIFSQPLIKGSFCMVQEPLP